MVRLILSFMLQFFYVALHMYIFCTNIIFKLGVFVEITSILSVLRSLKKERKEEKVEEDFQNFPSEACS